jgi:hypothetical protein
MGSKKILICFSFTNKMDENTLLLGKCFKLVSQEGENIVKGAMGANVKIIFKALHMTCIISTLVYNLKFSSLDT